MADENTPVEPVEPKFFDKVKAFGEKLSGGYAPWWVSYVVIVVVLAMIF